MPAPACGGKPATTSATVPSPAWGGWSNGRIPSDALCALGAPGHALRCDAAEGYAASLEGVSGFRLGNSWYAIALGPYAPDAAEERHAELVRLLGLPPYAAGMGYYSLPAEEPRRGLAWPELMRTA